MEGDKQQMSNINQLRFNNLVNTSSLVGGRGLAECSNCCDVLAWAAAIGSCETFAEMRVYLMYQFTLW